MLKEYLRLFGHFMKTASSVSKICRYLQRYWIPGNLGKTPSNVEVREIYPVSMRMTSKSSLCLMFFFVIAAGFGDVEAILFRSY